jgi:hypothetical protein
MISGKTKGIQNRMQLSALWLRFEPQKGGRSNKNLVQFVVLLPERFVEATLTEKADETVVKYLEFLP